MKENIKFTHVVEVTTHAATRSRSDVDKSAPNEDNKHYIETHLVLRNEGRCPLSIRALALFMLPIKNGVVRKQVLRMSYLARSLSK